MTAREILKKWRITDASITRIEEKLRAAQVTGVHPQNMSGMPHNSGISNPTERDALRISVLTEELREAIAFVLKVESCFSCLTRQQERVIRIRYKQQFTQEQTATLLGRDISNIQRTEWNALTKLEEAFHEENLL